MIEKSSRNRGNNFLTNEGLKLSIRNHLRRLVRSSTTLCSFLLVLRNVKSRFEFSRGRIETNSGTIHSEFSLKTSLDYIQEVFNDYKCYGQFEKFYGDVAEIGPGDSCGVGVKILQDGCKSVDLADKYFSHRDETHQKKIITVLCDSGADKNIFVDADHNDRYSEKNICGLTRYYGAPAASENFFGKKIYDFIVSRAVLEHVDDPVSSIRHMAKALASNGYLLHKVDLRDHMLFSPENSELAFLTFPNWYYRLMCKGSGRPNRVMCDQYEKVLDESGLHYSILVTSLIGVGEINPHVEWDDIEQDKKEQSLSIVRNQQATLSRDYKLLDEKYIAISGIFIVARKEL